MREEPTVADLRSRLTAARIKGRSTATTHADLMALCVKHGLMAPNAAAVDNPAELTTPTTTFHDMPSDVVELVLRAVVESSVVSLKQKRVREDAGALTRTMLALTLTNRGLRAMLPDTAPQWMEVLRVFADCETLHCRESAVALERASKGLTSPRRALCLVAMTGCELCGAKRIRKVYWEFEVRCCRRCLEANTISDYRLRVELGVSNGLLARMPHTVVQMYRPRVGTFDTRFYWTASALREIGYGVGVTLNDLRAEATARKVRGLFEAIIDSNSSLVKRARHVVPSVFEHADALQVVSKTFRAACRGEVTTPCPATVAREAVESAVASDVGRWIVELNSTSPPIVLETANAVRRCTLAMVDASLRGRALKDRAWFDAEVWPIEVAAAEAAAEAKRHAAEARKHAAEVKRRAADVAAEARRRAAKVAGDLAAEVKRRAAEARFTCDDCMPSGRLFCLQGMRDHARHVHNKTWTPPL